MRTIEEIENSEGLRLPNSYKRFVGSIADFTERYFKEDDDEDDDYPGRPWFLWGVDRLSEILEMRRVGVEPMFRSLALFTKAFSEFTSEKEVYSPEGPISLERVAKGFVIGEENGDYIYLDPLDEYSVWFYYHDGGDVKKVSSSFETWLSASTAA